MPSYSSQVYSKVLQKGFSWVLSFWEDGVDINFPNLTYPRLEIEEASNLEMPMCTDKKCLKIQRILFSPAKRTKKEQSSKTKNFFFFFTITTLLKPHTTEKKLPPQTPTPGKAE